MSRNYHKLVENAVAFFIDHPDREKHPEMAVAATVAKHTVDAELEPGNGVATETWHLLYDMIGYCEAEGFQRDRVFGPSDPHGPKIHKLAVGIQQYCKLNGIDYADLFDDAARERQNIEVPSAPKM